MGGGGDREREPGSHGGRRRDIQGGRRWDIQGGRRRDIQGGRRREQWQNFATLAQYFAIRKAHRGGNYYRRGREPGVQGAGGGMFKPPCPSLLPPPPLRY